MLVAALERHGLRTLQFPLLDIAPTPNLDDLRAALADPSRYALVVFVSPNAVQQAFAAMPEGFLLAAGCRPRWSAPPAPRPWPRTASRRPRTA